jgi:hypothetical protein
MPEFMITYGFKVPDEWDDATRLLDSIRQDQQKEWEDKQRATSSANATTPATDRVTMNAEDIATAIAWHEKMGHLNYYAVQHLPTAAAGVAPFKFNLDDIPVCQACAACGVDDRDPDGWKERMHFQNGIDIFEYFLVRKENC